MYTLRCHFDTICYNLNKISDYCDIICLLKFNYICVVFLYVVLYLLVLWNSVSLLPYVIKLKN